MASNETENEYTDLAIVFDLDGTLVDSIGDIVGAANRLLAEEGRAVLSRDAGRAMVGEFAGKEAAARVALLTPREREVFEQLICGHPNKAIALALGISPRTVEVYRARIMEKTQSRSVAELVRKALVLGIDPEQL